MQWQKGVCGTRHVSGKNCMHTRQQVQGQGHKAKAHKGKTIKLKKGREKA